MFKEILEYINVETKVSTTVAAPYIWACVMLSCDNCPDITPIYLVVSVIDLNLKPMKRALEDSTKSAPGLESAA